jgi:hypothetical protein
LSRRTIWWLILWGPKSIWRTFKIWVSASQKILHLRYKDQSVGTELVFIPRIMRNGGGGVNEHNSSFQC